MKRSSRKLCCEKTVSGNIVTRSGFYTNDKKPFIKFVRKSLKIDNTEKMFRKCSEVAIRASFYQ